MGLDKAVNLIDRFCKGEGNIFKNIPCTYFKPIERDCILIIRKKLKELFDHGRCKPYDILRLAVKKFFYKYRDIYKDEDNYIESVVFELMPKIISATLTGNDFHALKGYISVSAHHAVIKWLKDEKVLSNKVCNNCRHLSESTPNVCLRENIDVMVDKKIITQSNPYFNKRRTPSTDTCKEGFELKEHHLYIDDENVDLDQYTSVESQGIEKERTPENIALNIVSIQTILQKRCKMAKYSAQKALCNRQYMIFMELYRLLKDGFTESNAIDTIAEKSGITSRTVYRDLEAIKEYAGPEIS